MRTTNNFRVISNKNKASSVNITGKTDLPTMKPIKEMVKLTGLSYTYLRNLCLNNEIVYIRAGNRYLINYERFIDYLNGARNQSKPVC